MCTYLSLSFTGVYASRLSAPPDGLTYYLATAFFFSTRTPNAFRSTSVTLDVRSELIVCCLLLSFVFESI